MKREPADGRRQLPLPPKAPPSLPSEQVGLRASLRGRNVTEALFISLGGKIRDKEQNRKVYMKPFIKLREALLPRIQAKPGDCRIACNCSQGGCFLTPNYPHTPQFLQQKHTRQPPRDNSFLNQRRLFCFNSALLEVSLWLF